MAPVADYSTTPSDNTSISGLTVSDATVADALDNIIRQMMADIRSADDANTKVADNETITGNWTHSGTFTLNGAATFGNPLQVRAALLAPASPQAASGVGQWTPVSASAGASLSLPSGGTWAYFVLLLNSGVVAGRLIGVAAGNTLLYGGAPGIVPDGLAWRVS